MKPEVQSRNYRGPRHLRNREQTRLPRKSVHKCCFTGIDLADNGNGQSLILNGIKRFGNQCRRIGIRFAHQLCAQRDQPVLQLL